MIFSSDAELVSYTAWAIRIYMAAMCIFGIQMACQLTFISIGNAKASILVAVMRKFILLLPLIFLLPHLVSDPVTGVYLAEPVADFLAVTFTACLFRYQFGKALAELKKEA